MKYKQIIFFVSALLTGGITYAQTTQNAALDDFKAASSMAYMEKIFKSVCLHAVQITHKI